MAADGAVLNNVHKKKKIPKSPDKKKYSTLTFSLGDSISD
jgi:hypothetical protein